MAGGGGRDSSIVVGGADRPAAGDRRLHRSTISAARAAGRSGWRDRSRVESLSPHRVLAVDDNDELLDRAAEPRLDYARQQDFEGMSREGIVKLRLTAVSDPQHGGFRDGSSPVSWGSIDELFVNLTVPAHAPPMPLDPPKAGVAPGSEGSRWSGEIAGW